MQRFFTPCINIIVVALLLYQRCAITTGVPAASRELANGVSLRAVTAVTPIFVLIDDTRGRGRS